MSRPPTRVDGARAARDGAACRRSSRQSARQLARNSATRACTSFLTRSAGRGWSGRKLIEDKISAGAKQQEQLLRYCRSAVEAKPNKRVVAVYLAPGGMGAGEVEAVRRSALFARRQGDITTHVAWEEVAQLVNGLPEDERSWFARSGMDEIERAISQAAGPRVPASAILLPTQAG